jgi:hypothetical protein
MVRRPRRHPCVEADRVDLRKAQPGDVVQPVSGGEPVGDAPEVPTVGTEGVGGSPARGELVQEGLDQLADVRTGRTAPAGGSRARCRLNHLPILAAKKRLSVDLAVLEEANISLVITKS